MSGFQSCTSDIRVMMPMLLNTDLYLMCDDVQFTEHGIVNLSVKIRKTCS